MYNFDVPFTNNFVEQDIRICKVKFFRVRGYIATAKKHGISLLSVIEDGISKKPLMLKIEPT